MLERIRNQITELRKEEERRYTYEAEFSFSKELPVQYSEWMNTIWDISNRDKIKIYLVSEGGESFVRLVIYTISQNQRNCLRSPDWIHRFISLVISRHREPECPSEVQGYYAMPL